MRGIRKFGWLLLGVCWLVSDAAADCTTSVSVTSCQGTRPEDYSFSSSIVKLSELPDEELGPGYFKNVSGIANVYSFSIEDSKLSYIDPMAFGGMPKLNHLKLSNDEITDIDENTFVNLPDLEELNLNGNRLQEVRLSLNNVQEIVFSFNEIKLGSSAKLEGEHITFIDLSHNQIEKLAFSFSGTKNLIDIDLSFNIIETVEDFVFNETTYLEHVNMSHNLLSTTDGLHSSSLQSVDLSFNKFEALNSEMFYKFSQLQHLILSNNLITDLSNPFVYLHELQFLDLSNNQIENLSPDLFSHNLHLETLRLSNNKIQVLSDIAPLSALFYLDLSHNQITQIGDHFFQNILKLSTLDLSNNSLQDVVEPLAPLQHLIDLDLSNNQLRLDRDSVFKNQRLMRLNLSSNGISEFNVKYQKKLITLDISKNQISNLCQDWFAFKSLINLYLNENLIQDVNCLREKDDFPKLGILEISSNPLTCDVNLDDTIESFMQNNILPHSEEPSDIQEWNVVKKKLCPDGKDIHILQSDAVPQITSYEEGDDSSRSKEDQVDDDISTENKAILIDSNDTFDESKGAELDLPDSDTKPGDALINDELPPPVNVAYEDINNKPVVRFPDVSQSRSWEGIPLDVDDDFDVDDLRPNLVHFPWFTVAVVLLGIALALTIINIAVWIYFRRRGQSSDKYLTLKNEVYRDTTSPAENTSGIYSPSKVNKIFKADKFNEILLNFGLWRTTDADSESVKHMIVHNSVENC